MSITKHKCNLKVYSSKSNINKFKEKSDFKGSMATGRKISMLPPSKTSTSYSLLAISTELLEKSAQERVDCWV